MTRRFVSPLRGSAIMRAAFPGLPPWALPFRPLRGLMQAASRRLMLCMHRARNGSTSLSRGEYCGTARLQPHAIPFLICHPERARAERSEEVRVEGSCVSELQIDATRRRLSCTLSATLNFHPLRGLAETRTEAGFCTLILEGCGFSLGRARLWRRLHQASGAGASSSSDRIRRLPPGEAAAPARAPCRKPPSPP